MIRILTTITLAMLLYGCSITAPGKGNPGYAKLDRLSGEGINMDVHLSLGKLPLRLAASLVGDDEPETAAMLRDLDGIHIRVYELDNPRGLDQHLERMTSRLESQQWSRAVAFNEDDEQVRIYIRPNGTALHGVIVISLDDEEAVLINLIGDIDPDTWRQVTDSLL